MKIKIAFAMAIWVAGVYAYTKPDYISLTEPTDPECRVERTTVTGTRLELGLFVCIKDYPSNVNRRDAIVHMGESYYLTTDIDKELLMNKVVRETRLFSIMCVGLVRSIMNLNFLCFTRTGKIMNKLSEEKGDVMLGHYVINGSMIRLFNVLDYDEKTIVDDRKGRMEWNYAAMSSLRSTDIKSDDKSVSYGDDKVESSNYCVDNKCIFDGKTVDIRNVSGHIQTNKIIKIYKKLYTEKDLEKITYSIVASIICYLIGKIKVKITCEDCKRCDGLKVTYPHKCGKQNEEIRQIARSHRKPIYIVQCVLIMFSLFNFATANDCGYHCDIIEMKGKVGEIKISKGFIVTVDYYTVKDIDFVPEIRCFSKIGNELDCEVSGMNYICSENKEQMCLYGLVDDFCFSVDNYHESKYFGSWCIKNRFGKEICADKEEKIKAEGKTFKLSFIDKKDKPASRLCQMNKTITGGKDMMMPCFSTDINKFKPQDSLFGLKKCTETNMEKYNDEIARKDFIFNNTFDDLETKFDYIDDGKQEYRILLRKTKELDVIDLKLDVFSDESVGKNRVEDNEQCTAGMIKEDGTKYINLMCNGTKEILFNREPLEIDCQIKKIPVILATESYQVCGIQDFSGNKGTKVCLCEGPITRDEKEVRIEETIIVQKEEMWKYLIGLKILYLIYWLYKIYYPTEYKIVNISHLRIYKEV